MEPQQAGESPQPLSSHLQSGQLASPQQIGESSEQPFSPHEHALPLSSLHWSSHVGVGLGAVVVLEEVVVLVFVALLVVEVVVLVVVSVSVQLAVLTVVWPNPQEESMPLGVDMLPVAVENPVQELGWYVGSSVTRETDDAEVVLPPPPASGQVSPSRLRLGKPSTFLHFCPPKAML